MIEVKANTSGKVIINGSDVGQLKNDLDRVTAERDGLQVRVNELREDFNELSEQSERRGRQSSAFEDRMGDLQAQNGKLQDRLTESQQREARLQALLTAADERAVALEGLLREASVELHDFITGRLLDRIDAALKPVEGGVDA